MILEIVALLAIAGLVVLVWPSSSKAAPSLSATLTAQQSPLPSTVQTFQGAMVCLSHVRSRLLVTDQLGDEAKSAIETLTHALVEASDK
jgi:hypothetical protein